MQSFGHASPDLVDRITFRLNGVVVTVAPDVSPITTALHWLRGPAGLCGTKEGCAEGDCGACTVVLERPDGGRSPVNACLLALGQLHGASLRTVEGVRDHAIPARFAAAGATQCGFCTPGFVMAAWAHARTGGDPHEALAGNLCRCTGYRPITDVVAALADDGEQVPPLPVPAGGRFADARCTFHRPAGLDELLALRAAHPEAWLLAGGTDLGVDLAKGAASAVVIALSGVAELRGVGREAGGLRIGAATPYADLLDRPDLAALRPLLSRFGSRQIRALGTVGGNLGTASPIGDALPPLLALDATVRLRARSSCRDLPVADFLLGYRRTALRPGEIIESVLLPDLPPGARLVCEKLSKRHDQDISAVSAAFVTGPAPRLAFGGMGPVVARAPRAEAALTGEWSPAALERAADALRDDFAPLSDSRGTAAYRLHAAAGLLRRLWWRVERPDLPTEVHAL